MEEPRSSFHNAWTGRALMIEFKVLPSPRVGSWIKFSREIRCRRLLADCRLRVCEKVLGTKMGPCCFVSSFKYKCVLRAAVRICASPCNITQIDALVEQQKEITHSGNHKTDMQTAKVITHMDTSIKYPDVLLREALQKLAMIPFLWSSVSTRVLY